MSTSLRSQLALAPPPDLITAIVPVDLSRRPLNLLRRLAGLFAYAKAHAVRVVVGHGDRLTWADRRLAALCERHGVVRATVRPDSADILHAALRNAALWRVDTPLTLLLDADVHLPAYALFDAAAEVQGGNAPMRILPCLYLSRHGTMQLLRGRADTQALLDAYLQFRGAPFLHMALPSSIALFATRDFARAGGFDPRFAGHGYEDFDFLLRLARLHDMIPLTRAMLIDAPSRAPLLTAGFRSALARITLPAMLRGQVGFHLWHPTKRDAYYSARPRNAAYFRSKLEAMLPAERGVADQCGDPSGSTIDLELIAAFLAQCARDGVDARGYAVLFDAKPGHVGRFDSLCRKIRLLLNDY
jgi:predicted glycosyltransferase involved in capsule biosynthesis